MKLIDGQVIAAAVSSAVTEKAASLKNSGVTPTLSIVVPTDDEGSAWYVRSLARAAKKAGIECRIDQMTGASRAEIESRLDVLSADPSVHGIMCQTPLPHGVVLGDVGQHIGPRKDVDGANPLSLGRLAAGLAAFVPATAAAVLEILHRENVPLAGARAVVVGRSTVVGKPAALLLLAEHATVTVCHSRTKDLAEVCRQAEVLVVAVGRPAFVGKAHVAPGAVVVDVGTNSTSDGRLVGDVDQSSLQDLPVSLTPVPGGVGPVTTALLLRHVVEAAAPSLKDRA
jgi:methylenetetrahydrofolate dehydrogenase (NADP+) / methenyltetrahydrofolate cyclohydrolase